MRLIPMKQNADYNFKGSCGRRDNAPLIAAAGVGGGEFSGASVTDEFP